MLQIPNEKLKDLLTNDGLVTALQFDEAVSEGLRMNQGPAEVLMGSNLINAEYYYTLLAKYYNVEKADLGQRQIDEQSLRLLSEDLSRQKRVIMFAKDPDGSLKAAMEDPTDLGTIQFLSTHLKAKIKPYLASFEDLNRGLAFYSKKGAEDFRKVIEENIRESLRSKVKDIKEAALDLPIVAITDNLLSYATAIRSSDIHLEVFESEVLVRFRIDGVLHEMMRIQKEVHPAIVARVKLLAQLKLDEHFKPQDGRFRYKIGNDITDVRVSILPTYYGEKVVMRLLPATQHPLSFEELGMFPDTIKILKENIGKTYGIVLVTGPTGSGKTTTLYSVLNTVNHPEVNIVTIEDPVEYDMKYVNQTQVNVDAGMTFSSGLRSLLRQDPNIIMVGEIRDPETAEISVQAALTGHLVLSTLHTNDAPTAIPRLIDMRVEPFLIAAVLNAVMAQRLVRRICLGCIVSYKPTPEFIEVMKEQITELKINISYEIPKVLFKGQGCAVCGRTGYKGRSGIYEVLDVTETIRKSIISPRFSLDEMREIARKEGFVTMFEDGLRKVERGITTMEEVLRVIRE